MADSNSAISPLKAIKAFCYSWCGENYNEVKSCTAPNCPLYNFRLGRNSARKRVMTEEQREAARERLKAAREAKK